MRRVNNKTRREVIYTLSAYLYKRLSAYKELQNKRYIKEQELLVELDNFCEAFKIQIEILDLMDNRYSNRKRNKTVDFEEELRIRAKGNEEVERIIHESQARVVNMIKGDEKPSNIMGNILYDLKQNVAKRVVLSEENIEEILCLVKYYIDKYGLPKYEYPNENMFLRSVFKTIREKSKNSMMVALAEKYTRYFYTSKNAGFEEKCSCKIKADENNRIMITNQNGALLYAVGTNNSVSKRYCDNEDYLLFGKDIIRVTRINENGEVIHEFGRIIKDSCLCFFQSVLKNNSIYQIKDIQEGNMTKEYAYFDCFLVDYLKSIGLDNLYEYIYNVATLRDLSDYLDGISNVDASEISDQTPLSCPKRSLEN